MPMFAGKLHLNSIEGLDESVGVCAYAQAQGAAEGWARQRSGDVEVGEGSSRGVGGWIEQKDDMGMCG